MELEKNGQKDNEAPMSRLPQKIRAIRKGAKLKQKAFGAELGVSQGTISKWESDTSREEPGIENLKKLAEFKGISVDELIDYTSPHKVIPLIGFIGAGAEMILFSDENGLYQEVKAPEGSNESTVAVEVRGTSLGHLYDGWLVIYDKIHATPTPDLMGKTCVIGLKDGCVVVKRIDVGQIPNRYNLTPAEGPPTYDVEIVWAARVKSFSQDR